MPKPYQPSLWPPLKGRSEFIAWMQANRGEDATYLGRRYDRVLCPEMNLGQLASLLRDRYLVDVQRLTTVRGMPFGAELLEAEFLGHLDQLKETTP